jgi:hypothetical protein
VLVWVTVSFAIRQQGSPVNTSGLAIKERPFYNVPVVAVASAEDVRAVKVSPNEIEVAVQGDATIVDKLHSRDIRAIVDLTGVQAAPDLRRRVEIFVPSGIACVRVVPPDVQVIFPPKN